MKKLYIILTLLLLALLPGSISAQTKGGDAKSRKEMRQEMEDFKMKFFAQEMELQGETKEKFFELFRKYSDEMCAGFRQRRKAEKKLKGIEKPTDEDYAEVQKETRNAREREAAAETSFQTECAKILTPKQQFKLQEAQEKFRQKMIELHGKHKKK